MIWIIMILFVAIVVLAMYIADSMNHIPVSKVATTTTPVISAPTVSSPPASKAWYEDMGNADLTGPLAGWKVCYDAPARDEWRLDGLFQDYGATLLTDDTTDSADIIVWQEKNETAICYYDDHEKHHQITRRIARISDIEGYQKLVDRVVIEMAQTRFRELGKEYDRYITISKSGRVSFRPDASR